MTIGEGRTDVIQGTLDLMVLKTLDVMGPQHGYGIARRIEQVSDDLLPPAAPQRGHGLRVAPAAAAAGLDRGELGAVGEQPPRPVLRHH